MQRGRGRACREVRGHARAPAREEVLQVLDLALELAQLRARLLVLPLLAVEFDGPAPPPRRLERAAATVGDARRRRGIRRHVSTRPLRALICTRAAPLTASPSAFASSPRILPQRHLVLLDQLATYGTSGRNPSNAWPDAGAGGDGGGGGASQSFSRRAPHSDAMSSAASSVSEGRRSRRRTQCRAAPRRQPPPDARADFRRRRRRLRVHRRQRARCPSRPRPPPPPPPSTARRRRTPRCRTAPPGALLSIDTRILISWSRCCSCMRSVSIARLRAGRAAAPPPPHPPRCCARSTAAFARRRRRGALAQQPEGSTAPWPSRPGSTRAVDRSTY